MTIPFDRTYYVSNERLRAFRALTTEEKLRWIEGLASFLHLAQSVAPAAPQDSPPSNAASGLNQKDRSA